jgi:hypothetical protein
MPFLTRLPSDRRLVIVAAVLGAAVATTGGIVASSPAGATNVPIGIGNAVCPNSANAWCLYFSPNLENGNWGVNPIHEDTSNISGTFSDGDGPVKDNAASAINDIPACTIRIWSGTGYTGNSNSLPGQEFGNLTNSSPQLRNNEKSVDNYSCP